MSMNLKKVALKGVVTLAIVIALCMFFSQTIMTITTPKVKLTTAKHGRLEQNYSLTGELYYSASEAFTIDAARELSAIVVAIYVRPGDQVKAGDLLFATRLSADSDGAIKKADEALQAALDAQLKTQMEIAGRSVKETPKNEAERALETARSALSEKRRALIAQAHNVGLALPTDPGAWKALIEEKKDEKLTELYTEVQKAEEEEKDALDAFLAAHKRVGENTNYVTVKKMEAEQAAVDAAYEDLLQVQKDMEDLRSVRATRGGVVVSLDVKLGETVSGSSPSYVLAASTPVLRADVSEIRKEIAADTKVEIRQDYWSIKTRVLEVKRETAQTKYASIEITEEILDYYGGYRGLSSETLPLKITYTAKSSSSLLPKNAVHGTDGQYYVLVVEDDPYSFWGEGKSLRKQEVHVIEMSDTLCSIEEELYGQSIAVDEDRTIDEGMRVMEYLS